MRFKTQDKFVDKSNSRHYIEIVGEICEDYRVIVNNEYLDTISHNDIIKCYTQINTDMNKTAVEIQLSKATKENRAYQLKIKSLQKANEDLASSNMSLRYSDIDLRGIRDELSLEILEVTSLLEECRETNKKLVNDNNGWFDDLDIEITKNKNLKKKLKKSKKKLKEQTKWNAEDYQWRYNQTGCVLLSTEKTK